MVGVVVVIIVRLAPSNRADAALRGVVELVGGHRATFTSEAELAAFLHHCVAVRGDDDRR